MLAVSVADDPIQSWNAKLVRLLADARLHACDPDPA